MKTPQTSDCAKLLSPELLHYFQSTLSHKEFTAVQVRAGPFPGVLSSPHRPNLHHPMVGSSQQDAQQQRRWGEYYFGEASQPSSQLKGRKSWVLETIYALNQMIPSFNELFDQETFYVFALCVVAASVFAIFVMTRVFKVRVREYPLNVDREWRDWRPANPFRFPWSEQPTPARGASEARRPHQD